MACAQFEELVTKLGLSEKEYNLPIGDEHLETISRKSCKKWKNLPAHLDLKTIVAEDIAKEGGTEQEKRYNFLRQWQEIKGSEATYKRLITALLEINCMQDAETVCSTIKTDAVKTDHDQPPDHSEPPDHAQPPSASNATSAQHNASASHTPETGKVQHP